MKFLVQHLLCNWFLQVASRNLQQPLTHFSLATRDYQGINNQSSDLCDWGWTNIQMCFFPNMDHIKISTFSFHCCLESARCQGFQVWQDNLQKNKNLSWPYYSLWQLSNPLTNAKFLCVFLAEQCASLRFRRMFDVVLPSVCPGLMSSHNLLLRTFQNRRLQSKWVCGKFVLFIRRKDSVSLFVSVLISVFADDAVHHWGNLQLISLFTLCSSSDYWGHLRVFFMEL